MHCYILFYIVGYGVKTWDWNFGDTFSNRVKIFKFRKVPELPLRRGGPLPLPESRESEKGALPGKYSRQLSSTNFNRQLLPAIFPAIFLAIFPIFFGPHHMYVGRQVCMYVHLCMYIHVCIHATIVCMYILCDMCIHSFMHASYMPPIYACIYCVYMCLQN